MIIMKEMIGVDSLIRWSEIIEKPILNIGNKHTLALAYDVVLKKNSNEILGFVWRKKMLKKEFGIILFNDLLLKTKDGLFIKSSKVSKDFDYNNRIYYGLSYNNNFSNKIVLNRDGELIGIVRDILLDLDRGYFQSFEFSEGYIDDIITGKKLVMAGSGYKLDSDAITILHNEIIEEQGRGLLNLGRLN
ncbi:MAG: PRC-barrel domain-containing protein [Lutispora sp.]|nr:PRC-barrel domain-containing protein [Lutispora sp.]